MKRFATSKLKIRTASLLMAAIALIAIAGCNPNKKEPSIELPQNFTEQGQSRLPHRWWEAFDDPALDAMIEQALEENRDLLAAWDRLDQANAMEKMAAAGLWPYVSANLGYSTSRELGADEEDTSAAAAMGLGASAGPDDEIENWTLGLTASYEVDLWGRVRSARKASKRDLAATEEDLYSMAITISGEVARAWYELVELRGQLEVLAEQMKVNETYLEVLELRYEQGMAMAADVMQQRQQVESIKGETELTRMRMEMTEHRLDVLVGLAPVTPLDTEGASLPTLPPLPETGLPADLLLRRPDVRAARARFEAADHRVAEAVANQLPTISIALSGQDTEKEFYSLFENWTRNLAINLVAPIFDAGRRAAAVEQSQAAYSASLHAFESAMLNALREVEDALSRERAQARFVASLEEQVKLSQNALYLSREQYRNGAVSYLPVLINLQTVQRLERTLLEAQRTRVAYRVGLYRALAGGWDLERPVENERTE